MTLLCAVVLGVVSMQDAKPLEPVTFQVPLKEPKRVKYVTPEYPNKALQAGFAGIVILEASVDADGSVKDAKVLRGIPLLNEPAVAAVKRWRYEALLLNGTPSPFTLTVTVNFGPAPAPQLGAVVSLLKNADAGIREHVCLVVSAKAYRFTAADRKKLVEALHRLLETEQQERVKAAAASALAEVTK
jgi:TonB family protein